MKYDDVELTLTASAVDICGDYKPKVMIYSFKQTYKTD
jgi:hypothetical protein